MGEPCQCQKWNQCDFCGTDLMCVEGKCGIPPVIPAPEIPSTVIQNMIDVTSGDMYVINFGGQYCEINGCDNGQGSCKNLKSCKPGLHCYTTETGICPLG